MNKSYFALILAGLVLAGCSNGASLLDSKAGVPATYNVPTGNNLALPPDLSLAQPTATSDAYQPNGTVEQPVDPIAAKPAPLKSAVVARPPATGDIFDQYGIAKFKPDGTKKTSLELNEELTAAIKAKRRQTNPGYGTIANIGAIFQDQ